MLTSSMMQMFTLCSVWMIMFNGMVRSKRGLEDEGLCPILFYFILVSRFYFTLRNYLYILDLNV